MLIPFVNKGFFFGFLVHILPKKMARASMPFTLLMMLFTHCSFTPTCPLPFGSRPSHVYLLNQRPKATLGFKTPFAHLFVAPPDLSVLHVFGCLCYLNLASTANHKLFPCSAACVFLSYTLERKGYRCYNPLTQ